MIKGMFPPYKYGIRKGMGAGGVSGASIPRSGLQFYADLWHPEQQGFCLSFDGNDKVAIADQTTLEPATVSVSVWFRTTGTSGAMVEKWDAADATYPYTVKLDGTGKVLVSCKDASNEPTAISTAAVNDGRWHNAVGIRSVADDKLYIYVDGVLNGTGTTDTTAGALTNTSGLYFGMRGNGAIAYTGEIGQVAVLGRQMTPAEILTNFQRGRKATLSDLTSIAGYWKLDEGTGEPQDSSGNGYHGTLTGATWVEGLMDRSTNALALTSFGSPVWSNQGRTFVEANSGRATVAYSAALDLTTTFSAIVWFKSTNATNFRGILAKGGTAASSSINFYRPDNNTVRCHFTPDEVVFSAVSSIATNWWDGTWHMYAIKVNSSAAVVYQNGVQDNTGTFNQIPSTGATQIWRLAQYGSAAPYTSCTIGEVNIYNRALSSQEILQIFNATRFRYGV